MNKHILRYTFARTHTETQKFTRRPTPATEIRLLLSHATRGNPMRKLAGSEPVRPTTGTQYRTYLYKGTVPYVGYLELRAN